MSWKNIWDYFSAQSEEYANETALTYKAGKQWYSLSYSQYYKKVLLLAAGISEIGIKPGEKVAIYAPNCPEWKYAYLACMANAATVIPIDNKMSIAEFGHIMNSSRAAFLIISQNDLSDQLIEVLHRIKYIDKTIVIGDNRELVKEFDLEESKAGKTKKKNFFLSRLKKKQERSLQFFFINDLYYINEKEEYQPPAQTHDNEIASIIYTSGTMGIPKGVMLTHKNFLVNMQQIQEFLSAHLELTCKDRMLLVLPLNHSYAFTANFLLPLLRGMEVIFVESLTRVTQNALEKRPTILIAVPLLLEKMYGRIHDQIQSSLIKKVLFRFSWFKRIVGKKFNEKLGGSLRFIISGGAPLDPNICRNFWEMGLPVLQGYGMTEASPVISVNPPSHPKYSSVGIPLPGIEVKTVQENEEGIGELIVKGRNVMNGYYEMPDETSKVLRDKWLYTGDQGYVDEDNYIFIKGRKKNIIINREGKNIYPEEIEIVLNDSPFIQESLVLGYREQETPGEKVGVIIVPDLEYFEEWGSKHSLTLTDEVIEKKVQEEVEKLSQVMASYNRPRKIKIRTEPFDKTPTQKIKRSLYEF